MSYLFDTDILSNSLKKQPSEKLLERLSATPRHQQFTSTVTVGEMLYGALKSARTKELIQRFEAEVWPRIHILPFDFAAAEQYAKIRDDLERKSTMLADPDLRIAATALSRNYTLVTGNVRHFERIPGLIVENWL